MSTNPLPMAPDACTLDQGQLAEQAARYRRLGSWVRDITIQGSVARVRFDPGVDGELLQRALDVERGCCSFFALDYDAPAGVLSIAAEPSHGEALSALLSMLTPSGARRQDATHRCAPMASASASAPDSGRTIT